MSGKLIAALTVLAFALAAPTAAAATKTFDVKGDFQENQYYFEFEGVSGANPTVTLDPGDEVTVTFTVGANVHNFHVGAPVEKATEIISGDAVETLTFTVPESAAGTTIEYWCDPHKAPPMNMKGTFRVSGESTTPPPTTKDSPGFEAALAGLAVVAALLVLGRRRG